MFGALNRFIGRLDGEPGQQPRSGPGDNAFGFQVLRNKDPELPLEPWFDFIVGINGHTIVRIKYSYVFFDAGTSLTWTYRKTQIQTSLRQNVEIAPAEA
jgi:hypothetical protein